MASLADSFLQDLEDLEDQDEDPEEAEEEPTPDPQTSQDLICSHLLKDSEFLETVKSIKDVSLSKGELKEDYIFIEKSNNLISAIDQEIITIHQTIKEIYSKKLPELESIVFTPLEYIATVQRIKNQTDLTKVDLTDILPSTIIMAVTVASSMTTGLPLPTPELTKLEMAADQAMQLAEHRRNILLFLQSRMNILAPNVSAVIGTALAARLITHAGGLVSLARMPAQNIMLVGSAAAKTGGGAGAGTNTTGGSGVVARGVIYNCDIIQNAPPSVRNRALKLVAGKLSLVARVDSFHESPDGQIGVAYREKIVAALLKAQEPPPAPTRRALPIPDEGPRRRRGGKRHRRAKEKYGQSELRKQANRLKFGAEAEEEVGQETGNIGLGMITGSSGVGKLRLQSKQQKVLVKQQKKQMKHSAHQSAVSGMTSSLVFTPLQGIELVNPDLYKK